MDRLIPAGRIIYALALIGLGLEHFIYGEFITGRAPAWPEGIPGGLVWAYVSGAIVVSTCVAILVGVHARIAAIALGTLIFLWAVLRHIPVVVTSEILSPDWTRAVKALAFFGGAFAAAATLPRVEGLRNARLAAFINQDSAFILLGTICLAVFMVNNGIQHFIYDEFVASLIPAWIPGDPYFWTYSSAFFLFAGAAGMLYRPTAALAALLTGIMVFSWVWIVHVPLIFNSVSDNIAIFEAPAICGIALLLAGYRYQEKRAEAARPLEAAASITK